MEYKLIKEFESENRGLYNKETDELLIRFKSEEEVKQIHSLYLYIGPSLDNGNLVLKFGEAKKTKNIYGRYKGGQDAIKPYHSCIWLGDGEGDKIGHKELKEKSKIHKKYKWIDSKDNEENYEMFYGIDSIEQFTFDLEEIYKTKDAKQKLIVYKDVWECVKELAKKTKKKVIEDLCTRWGKTNTNLLLMLLRNMIGYRISIMFSYVGTVRNSYLINIEQYDKFENIKFIDLSNICNIQKTVGEIDEWLKNKDHHVMLYFALTGGTDTYNERSKILKYLKFYKYTAFIEEADFGAHCDNINKKDAISQLNKINKTLQKYNIDKTFIASGTGLEKLKKFVKDEEFDIVTRRYVQDVLNNCN